MKIYPLKGIFGKTGYEVRKKGMKKETKKALPCGKGLFGF
jgi:hypothetical protein